MITEIAQIDVKPGSEKDFEAAVAKARPLFLRAKGGKGFELHRSIEKPSRYRLMAKWETLENHTHFLTLYRQFVEGHPVKLFAPPAQANRLAFEKDNTGIRDLQIV